MTSVSRDNGERPSRTEGAPELGSAAFRPDRNTKTGASSLETRGGYGEVWAHTA